MIHACVIRGTPCASCSSAVCYTDLADWQPGRRSCGTVQNFIEPDFLSSVSGKHHRFDTYYFIPDELDVSQQCVPARGTGPLVPARRLYRIVG